MTRARRERLDEAKLLQGLKGDAGSAAAVFKPAVQSNICYLEKA